MSPFAGLTEIRGAFRGLQRSPTIALSAVVCIGLGLGSTAAISSAVDRALVQRSSAGDILGLVTRQAVVLLAIGIGIGLVGSFAATQLLVGQLYGVSPLDGPAWLAATATLAVAGLLAALLPAWRATRADPVVALRAE